MEEGRNIDKKSFRFLKGKTTDWNELAKDCVAFANAQGGYIFIGHSRIGNEINMHKVRRILSEMVKKGKLTVRGSRRWARYSIEQNAQENE